MLGRLVPFALIALCDAYLREATSLTGQEFAGMNFKDKADSLRQASPRYGKLEMMGECCSAPGEAEQVENDVNTNSVYGSKAEIAEEVFKYTSCSYFMVFQNTAHADHSYAANCVPAQMCMDNVVGMTQGRIATYGVVERIAVVEQILQQYIGKGPLDKCGEGETRVNEGDLNGLIKEERAVKLGSLNVIADIATGGKAAAKKQALTFDGMEKIPAVKSFNKCVNDASVGYLFVFKNGYWSSDKSDVDLGAFSKYKEEQTKIKEQKKEAAAKAKAAAEEVSQRRLSEQDAVLV
ncbi:unnamed protein product [Symbiodinium necroappetens]|uniref:Uncharacterized protein n=1 Tax=Symbiodinium necroappetens TaxID=1628268 RepID=A0A812YBL1_9DINO|nr:unnamed protein product [Symbiodinium necroappetens]